MRVLLPLAIFLVLAGPLPGAESATDLTTRLLRMLGTEEVAALKQKPPDSSRTAALGRAAELLRPYADAEHAADHFKKWDAGVFPQLQGMLGEFPKLAKLAEQWNESRRADYFAWEKTVLAEMHKAARDAVVKACKAEKPGDLDEPITSLATILGKYFYNRGATTWPAWESGARDITDLLSFVNLLRNLLAAEEEGRRREALGMLRTLFHEKSAPCFAPAELHALLNRHARKLGMPSTDEAEDAVRGIIAKAMAAAKPAELDPPLDQINRAGEMWSDLRSSDDTIRTLFRLTEVGREFVVRWQDFLIQRASGEIKSAQATLRNLAAKAETEPLYPRAQLLEIAAERSAIVSTLLEDIERTDLIVYVTDSMPGVR